MKFVLMSEPAQKCESYEAIFKQNNPLEPFISLKMDISCYFCLRGNLDFPDFHQIKFYNINYGSIGLSTPARFWSCIYVVVISFRACSHEVQIALRCVMEGCVAENMKRDYFLQNATIHHTMKWNSCEWVHMEQPALKFMYIHSIHLQWIRVPRYVGTR